MTSRRDFLKAAAIAPVAVPAIARAAAEQSYASGGFVEGAWGVVGEGCHGGFSLSPSQSKAFLEALERPMAQLEPIKVLMNTRAPWDEPLSIGVDMGAGDDRADFLTIPSNGLAGAYINEDGDAV